ncbi:hypothetical protein V5O48_000858 [Marasmius crinis-equi]|uniref:Protein FRA10AC1 n=1 Tax=Marasmius crinis-equi TaxID=585013 RepID=A0ABR3G011_9AGAR
MSLTHYPPSKSKVSLPGQTEFEILKASHKFLREDDADEQEAKLTWDDKLAAKYYASLYREFAVCDLKHYKSGEFALRWRTENEVLSGAGESTCGNTRCKHHGPQSAPRRFSDGDDKREKKSTPLTTLELPFAYVEHGENKSALVKVVLCEKCLNKLMWKRRKEREKEQGGMEEDPRTVPQSMRRQKIVADETAVAVGKGITNATSMANVVIVHGLVPVHPAEDPVLNLLDVMIASSGLSVLDLFKPAAVYPGSLSRTMRGSSSPTR